MKFSITKERFGVEYASFDFEAESKAQAFEEFKQEVSQTEFKKGLKLFLVQPVKKGIMNDYDTPLAFATSKDTVGVYDEELMPAQESVNKTSSKNIYKSIIESLNKKEFSKEDARLIGDQLGVDWDKVDIDQFHQGVNVELEHGKTDPETNVTNDDKVKTGKIALKHLKEKSDYYTRLKKVEK